MRLENNSGHITGEYEALTRLFDLQSASTRQFFQEQAARIVSILGQKPHRIQFEFPERVTWGDGDVLEIRTNWRRQVTGNSIFNRFHRENRNMLRHHLNKLEQSTHAGLAVCSKLLGYAIAHYIVYDLLPDGAEVSLQPDGDDEIPSIPMVKPSSNLPKTTRKTYQVADVTVLEPTRVQVPNIPTAHQFFLPQWVAFGEADQLLVASTQEAEDIIRSLQNAVRLLQEAESVCIYIAADETYQRKRAGLLGQLIYQGRALARYHTNQIITRLRARASAGELNRGLQLSLPYFELNDLSLHLYPIKIIPAGHVMFIPEFVVLAMQMTAWKVQQDPKISSSSCRHLLTQIASIENAFNKYTN